MLCCRVKIPRNLPHVLASPPVENKGGGTVLVGEPEHGGYASKLHVTLPYIASVSILLVGVLPLKLEIS